MHLLVALQNAGRVLRLDAQGKVMGPLMMNSAEELAFRQPHAVAADSAGRIWVSEPNCGRIRIFDPCCGQTQTLDELAGCSVALNYPVGLYRTGDDRMLIADMGNHRVLTASASGEIQVLCDRRGQAPGEFQHPLSFCAGRSSDSCWVVDLRNHRLQEVSSDGSVQRRIGRAGLGAGCLVLPESAAVLDDGSIVVAQWACIRALTLFSPDGAEMGYLPLDYSPKGMLVHQGRLMVCDWSGDHVIVYEYIGS
jgi:hypothetical protein